ncbi:MAG: endonuclease/exonuclease/phosphatase family protein [Akkermansiaceae bacterium]
MKRLFFLLILSSWLPAAEVRVATMNVFLGIEEPGTTSHDALAAVLGRIDADVVALQEVQGQDRSGNPSNLDQLATSLGYSHVFVPSGTAFDTNSGVILMSKLPFLETASITSPLGAKDLTRIHAVAKVDVPGTSEDPTIVTLHLKCCFDPDDFFRRAVEMERIKIYLDDEGLDGSDNVIVLGDFNLLGSPQTYNSLPDGLPVTYSLGPDISFPVQYYMNPVSYFNAYPLVNPMPLQQDGMEDATFQGGSVLDYIIISQALLDLNPVLEVYNSELEANFLGLPKSGSPLAAGVSEDASDHYAIFGDFNLDAGALLDLTLGTTTLSEAGPGTALTVTLPSPPAQPVTVLLCSAETDEAMPAELTLTFPAGVTTQSTTLLPKEDSIIDGDQTFTLMAAAAGFQGASLSVTVIDTDQATYQISALNTPVIEEFTGFVGTTAPAGWTVSTGTWLGIDDGSSSSGGLRSYGNDGSIGILANGQTSFTASFENMTGDVISTLEINYEAEQWRAALDGAQDKWTAEVITAAGTTLVPGLEFTAANDLPSGMVIDETSTALGAILSGLSIPAGASFQIRFTAIPGAPGVGGGDAIFLNEFHYDNTSNDVGEFVEIVVGPDYSGTLADIEVIFYNGSNGSPDGTTHSVDSFTLGETTASGHRIFWKDISGIQNGSPDGIAIVVDAIVEEFQSYEGVMTGMAGPASGMTSVDIGVSQPGSLPAGENSLGLSGTGSGPGDFSWERFAGSFTKGMTNAGQTFGASTLGQGIALDSLSVTALSDYTPVTELTVSPNFILSFPTEAGLSYEVQSSTTLQNWTFFNSVTGDGSVKSFDVSSGELKRFFRAAISPTP